MTVIEDFFYVSSKIWIQDRNLPGFLFVGLGKCDAFRDGAAHRLGWLDNRHRLGIVLDDNLSPGPHPFQRQLVNPSASRSANCRPG